jgi:hypothetical protein
VNELSVSDIFVVLYVLVSGLLMTWILLVNHTLAFVVTAAPLGYAAGGK